MKNLTGMSATHTIMCSVLHYLYYIFNETKTDPDNNNIMTNVRPQIKLKKRYVNIAS